jgi:hypothetical protein
MRLVLSICLCFSRSIRNTATDPRYENTTRSGRKVTPTRISSTGWTLEVAKMSTFQNGLGPAWMKREYDICHAKNAKGTWSKSTMKACYAGPKMVNAYRHLPSGGTQWTALSQSPTALPRRGAIQPVVRKRLHHQVSRKVIRTSVWVATRMLLVT